MASADLDQRSSLRRSAGLVDDLPQWRDRLEQLWRLNIEEIIELSLAYHGAASARRVGAGPELAGRLPADPSLPGLPPAIVPAGAVLSRGFRDVMTAAHQDCV